MQAIRAPSPNPLATQRESAETAHEQRERAGLGHRGRDVECHATVNVLEKLCTSGCAAIAACEDWMPPASA